MNINFTKMHGCGNDYVYIDCFKQEISNPEQLSIDLADRHFGVGGDGIVLICPSEVADAKMRMFNADGSEGKMCGNAIRCVGKYLYDNKYTDSKEVKIDTLSGVKTLQLQVEDGLVEGATVNMGKPILNPKEIPVLWDKDQVIHEKLMIEDKEYEVTCVSMGNPHCIVYCEDVDAIEIEKIGPKFEHNPIFPERTNTEFVQIIDEKTIKMRVWERGSGETLACGTGACASVVATVLNNFAKKETNITVKLRGGNLIIRYCKDETVYMTGSATKVFEGVVTHE